MMLKKTLTRYVTRLFSSKKHASVEVYGPKEHHIDKHLVSRHAIKVCEVLQQKGYKAYIVGGAVRDLMLGHEPKDFDVATNATPEKIRSLFRRARIIGRRFRLVHVLFGAEVIETSTFRASGDQVCDEQGRILNDNVFGDIQSDATRRDFTLNALYYDPIQEEVLDYHQGVQDLHKRLVRIIGNPEQRYREDPVRMLRAIRFAAKLNAKIEKNTHAPLKTLGHLLANVPEARLFDETIKLLTCGNAMQCLELLQAEGLNRFIFPLLDLIFKQEGGKKFIELTLERTDQRVRSNKPVSTSFLYAALLWPLLKTYHQQELQKADIPPVPALINATQRILDEQTQTLHIQKRHSAEMREIWLMQPRFNKRSPRFIWKMSAQPYFRAACDFLQIRAACHEVDSVLAQWWMDFANASDAEKASMVQALSQKPHEEGKRQRRTRRRSSKKKWAKTESA